MIGLLDTRYRYSDDATHRIRGVTPGILPACRTASATQSRRRSRHCVHQIRTMLQINGGAARRHRPPRSP
jgi:hypothetical protein